MLRTGGNPPGYTNLMHTDFFVILTNNQVYLFPQHHIKFYFALTCWLLCKYMNTLFWQLIYKKLKIQI